MRVAASVASCAAATATAGSCLAATSLSPLGIASEICCGVLCPCPLPAFGWVREGAASHCCLPNLSKPKPLVQGKVILVQLVQCKVLLATCPTCQWQFGFVDTLRPIPRRRDCDIWPNTSCFISSEFEYIEWQPMRISTTPTSTPASPYLQSSHPTDGILQFL